MTARDGNGWVISVTGQRLWGLHGAAGVLLAAPGPDGTLAVLLQRRAWWTDHGGSWGLPGGAIDSHESAPVAALRELREETGIPGFQTTPCAAVVTARHTLRDATEWTYTTVIATTAEQPLTFPGTESAELAWVPVSDVERLALHPGLAASWERLAALVAMQSAGMSPQ